MRDVRMCAAFAAVLLSRARADVQQLAKLLSEWLSPLAVLAEPCLCLDVC